jgi:hypothetical protein
MENNKFDASVTNKFNGSSVEGSPEYEAELAHINKVRGVMWNLKILETEDGQPRSIQEILKGKLSSYGSKNAVLERLDMVRGEIRDTPPDLIAAARAMRAEKPPAAKIERQPPWLTGGPNYSGVGKSAGRSSFASGDEGGSVSTSNTSSPRSGGSDRSMEFLAYGPIARM